MKPNKNKLGILFIPAGDEIHQSTKHRCYLHLDEFKNKKIKANIIPLKKGKSSNFLFLLWAYFLNFIKSIMFIPFYNIIFFQRRKDFFSVILLKFSKILDKKVIYDFDDAIYLDRSIKFFNFFEYMVQKSDLIICSNRFLKNHALKFNKNIYVLSSPVDTSLFKPIKREENKIFTIGWLGPGEDHFKYLKLLEKPLILLTKKHKIKLKLVSSLGSKKIYNLFKNIQGLEVDYGNSKWIDFERIPKEISEFDVSILPLRDDEWSRGKQAMKLLESMSMEIPVIGSDIGYNNEIIKEGLNGFLFKNPEDFVNKIEELMNSKRLRFKMGKNGRKFILKNYSLVKINKELLDIIKNETK